MVKKTKNNKQQPALSILKILAIGFVGLILLVVIWWKFTTIGQKASMSAAVNDIKFPPQYALSRSLYYPNQLCLDTCTQQILDYSTTDSSAEAESVVVAEINKLGYKHEAGWTHSRKYKGRRVSLEYSVKHYDTNLLASSNRGSTVEIVLTLVNNESKGFNYTPSSN